MKKKDVGVKNIVNNLLIWCKESLLENDIVDTSIRSSYFIHRTDIYNTT